jgi:pimeloyl-ACP methyl ester carboxylesterase
MTTRPRLDLVHDHPHSRDLVVIAHGGQEQSTEVPRQRGVALLRMWPFVAAARKAAPQARIGLVRYRFRGWNGAEAHAMADVRTVLHALPDDVERIVLIGHSMGARAVLRCGDDPRVVGILALAPWLPVDEPVPNLGGRVVVTAHGDGDRITDPRATSRYVARLRASGVRAANFNADGETHALLQRHRDWDELVRRFVTGCLVRGQLDAVINGAMSTQQTQPTALPHWSRFGGRVGGVVSIARARRSLHD